MGWLWDETCHYCRAIRKALVVCYYLLAFYGLCLLLVWTLDTSPVALFAQGRIDVPEVKPGDVFVIYQPVRKLRDCNGEAYRYISGECGTMPVWQGETTTQVGFVGNLILPVELPRQAKPGQCAFQSRIRYFCNPIDWLLNRNVVYAPPVPFQVVE